MRLLDLFCGPGGCSVGYNRAGFEVMGIDIKPQPSYPFEFVEGDALDLLRCLLNGGYVKPGLNTGPTLYLEDFDAITASPPCQRYSSATRCNKNRKDTKTAADHPDLVPATRKLLEASGKPWVMENVPNAPMIEPLMLCGTMFKLRVIRHRLFESSFFLWSPGNRCAHPPRGTVGKAGARGKKVGDWISVAGSTIAKVAAPAMGIDWVKRREELSQMIPPAYTEFIGKQLLESINAPTHAEEK